MLSKYYCYKFGFSVNCYRGGIRDELSEKGGISIVSAESLRTAQISNWKSSWSASALSGGELACAVGQYARLVRSSTQYRLQGSTAIKTRLERGRTEVRGTHSQRGQRDIPDRAQPLCICRR